MIVTGQSCSVSPAIPSGEHHWHRSSFLDKTPKTQVPLGLGIDKKHIIATPSRPSPPPKTRTDRRGTERDGFRSFRSCAWAGITGSRRGRSCAADFSPSPTSPNASRAIVGINTSVPTRTHHVLSSRSRLSPSSSASPPVSLLSRRLSSLSDSDARDVGSTFRLGAVPAHAPRQRTTRSSHCGPLVRFPVVSPVGFVILYASSAVAPSLCCGATCICGLFPVPVGGTTSTALRIA